MTDQFTPRAIPTVEVERVISDFDRVQLGQWYWVSAEDKQPRLMCVMEVGSNFVKLESPPTKNGWSSIRVHRDNVVAELTLEDKAQEVIKARIDHYQAELANNLTEIHELTRRLGVGPQIGHQSSASSDNKSLALLNGQVDVNDFKKALIEAKEVSLPQLFEKNKELSEELTRWMSAPSMSMKALLGPMKESVNKIEDRLFSIQLYTGMLEEITTIAEGQPASQDEKLRVMQRRLYMDEECLLNYEAGGMQLDDIYAFDSWLARPENRDRILPFQRCMVSMRVRRSEMDRGHLDAYIQICKKNADQSTFLFIRNGDNLYRLRTDIDFGEMMFPDRSVYDPTEPMMMKFFAGRVKEIIPKRVYDHMAELNAKHDQWREDFPKEQWLLDNPGKHYYPANPYESFSDLTFYSWYELNESSVYYDEGVKLIEKEIKAFNRIAVVVQGLFDRTTMLAPHHPAQIWQPASFAKVVELIYDSSMVLHWGEAPSITDYVAACNALTDARSVMFGQEQAWLENEAAIENRRIENDWRVRNHKPHKTFRHYGDHGPGRLARMHAWKPRSKKATFTWRRESRRDAFAPLLKAKVVVPLDKLFNVSAYKLGDFKQFFKDPRTRANYLEWAPMLLSAEEYHHGNLTVQEPDQE